MSFKVRCFPTCTRERERERKRERERERERERDIVVGESKRHP